MELNESEYYVSRIISGTQLINTGGRKLLLKRPNRIHFYLANELYKEILEEEAFFSDMFTEQQLKNFMLENNLWSEEEENRINSLQKDIEELKVRMYSMNFNSSQIKSCKNVLSLAKKDLNSLLIKKNSMDYLTISGYAETEKNKFLIAMSLRDMSNKPFIKFEDYWNTPSYIIEDAIFQYKNTRMDESQIRWLCRNEPWRSYWAARKSSSSLFGIPSVDLNDEQKTVVIWSNIYDAIIEHPDCPSNSVIEDDDLLDGWMILQKRKREKELNKNEAENLIKNERIKNSGEVFLVAKNKNDLQKISSLNDVEADILKRQRLNYVSKHEKVLEAEMPDSKQKIREQFMESFKSKIKKG